MIITLKFYFFFVSLGQHKWRKRKQVCCWKLNLIGRIESRFLKLLDNWWGTQNPKWLAEKKVTKNRSLGPAAAASANSYGQHTIVNDGQVGPKPNHFISIIEIVFSPHSRFGIYFFQTPEILSFQLGFYRSFI